MSKVEHVGEVLDEIWNNSSKIEMFSNTIKWLDDWVENNGPEQLNDFFDMENWMESEMIEAIECYLSCSFKKTQTKIDCIDILKSVLFEYYNFRKVNSIRQIEKNEHGRKRRPARRHRRN